MIETYLDLKQFMNDRTFYESVAEGKESEHYGWWGYCSCDDIFRDVKSKDGIAFRFEKNADSNDNVRCEKQSIDAHGVYCDKIAVAGYCSWGYFQETFKFEFEGETENGFVWFSDLVLLMRDVKKDYMDIQYTDYCRSADPFTEIGVYSSEGRRTGYVYYTVFSFPEKRALRRIVFPDNRLMSIMGITLIES